MISERIPINTLYGSLKRFAIRRIAISAGLIVLAALPLAGQKKTKPDPVVPKIFPMFVTSSLRHGNDTTVSPCVDFDQFVNGTWRASATVPDSLERIDAMTAAYDSTQRLFTAILDSASRIATTTKNADLRVLGQYYESCIRVDSLSRNLLRLSMYLALKNDTSRASRCTRIVMHELHWAMEQVFAFHIFTPEAEKRFQRMLEDIRGEVKNRIRGLTFISEKEKEEVLFKLDRLTFKVGKPTDTIDYSELTLDPKADPEENQRAVKTYVWRKRTAKTENANRPQFEERLYNPNAFFMSQSNSVEIPALLFFWPFFDSKNEPALEYGSAGATVGHEIIHAVTYYMGPQGANTVHNNAQTLVAQYSAMPPVEGVALNGSRTLNENLADLGGLIVSYTAWSRNAKPSAAPLIDGFTPDQRFFIHYARHWRTKNTERWLKQRLVVHSPSQARINGVVMNMPEFGKAFGCKDGDPMAKSEAQRAKIW